MPEKHYEGTIKFFSYKRGYGFIMPDNMKEDIFFHFSAISQKPGMVVYLLPNERIEFELEKGPRGLHAKNICSKVEVKGKINDKRVYNIYYHYYYSFKKMIDILIENEKKKYKINNDTPST